MLLCRMKILAGKNERIYDIGFIDPNTIHEVTINNHANDTKVLLLRFLKEHMYKSEILFPYNFR